MSPQGAPGGGPARNQPGRPGPSRSGGPHRYQPKRGRLAPLPGAATLVSLAWQLRSDPPDVTTDETEAVLTRSPGGSGAVVEIGGKRATATGFTPEDDRTLQHLFASTQARLAIVLFLDIHPDGSRGPRLDLNVYAYQKGPTGTPLAIGVADKEFTRIYRAAGEQPGRRPPEWTLSWLTERLVLPPLPGSPPGTPGRLQLLALDGDLARAEPKRLRYRLLHTAARLTRGQRRRWLRIPSTWPWANQLTTAFGRIAAIPAPG